MKAALALGWSAIRFENAVQAERDLSAAARAGSIDLG